MTFIFCAWVDVEFSECVASLCCRLTNADGYRRPTSTAFAGELAALGEDFELPDEPVYGFLLVLKKPSKNYL